MRWDGAWHVAEGIAFSVVVILYIWFRPLWWSWSLLIPLALVAASFVWHSETAASLGLSFRAAWDAIAAWRWWLVAVLVPAVLLALWQDTPRHLVYRWFGYLCWCIVQQLLLQNMAYRRLREGLGASWRTSAYAGALFGAAHMPNPVLMPATFLWGTVSTRMFEARRSVPVLGVCQALLSASLYSITPVALNGQFRVGPGYWAAAHNWWAALLS